MALPGDNFPCSMLKACISTWLRDMLNIYVWLVVCSSSNSRCWMAWHVYDAVSLDNGDSLYQESQLRLEEYSKVKNIGRTVCLNKDTTKSCTKYVFALSVEDHFVSVK